MTVKKVTLSIPAGPVYQLAVVASPLGGCVSLPLHLAYLFQASVREQAGRVH